MPIQATVQRKKVVKPEEYVHNYDQPAEQQEYDVMNYLEKHFTTHPKRMMKTIQALRGKVPTWVEKSICDVAYSVTDLIGWMQLCFKESRQYPVMMKKLRDEGNHGMVFWKNELWGFSLNTNQNWLNGKAKEKWSPEQEEEILTEALASWMVANRVRKFNDRIMLFAEYGFSGIPRLKPTEMDNESWAEVQRAHKAKQDNEDLKRLLAL